MVQDSSARIGIGTPRQGCEAMCISNPHLRMLGAIALSVLLSPLVSAQEGTWVAKAPMPSARWGVCAGVVEGKLYVVGGAAGPAGISLGVVEAYDPITDTWTTKAPIPTPRVQAAAAVVNGTLYVVGGQFQDAFGVTFLDTVEAYDPRTNTWTTRAPMPTPRSGLALGAVNGILYAVGGFVGGLGLTNTVEAYDPKTNTWSSMAPMPTRRENLAVGVAGGFLYAFGGFGLGQLFNNVPLATVERYDPQTNTWTSIPSMPTARSGAAAASAGGLIFVVGGQGTGTYLPTVEVFDAASSSWAAAPQMTVGRVMVGLGAADDILYAVGGFGERRSIFRRNEAFSPFLPIGIDIKPGDAKNTINLNAAGTVLVAILGSATFDPMSVDPATVTLAGAPVATRGWGLPFTARADFNHDGFFDLLLHFRARELELPPTASEAVLYATTATGQRLRGADAVRLLLPPGGAQSSTPAAKAPRTRQR